MELHLSSSASGREHEGQDSELDSALTMVWHLGTLRSPIVQHSMQQFSMSGSSHGMILLLKGFNQVNLKN